MQRKARRGGGIYIYTPNHIPPGKRLGCILGSVFLFAYGLYGLWENDLVIPGRRFGIHLDGPSAWIMFCAILCACAVMLSVVVDHYDQENNETQYWLFARAFTVFGWGLFALSLLVELFL